jgi:hypothetical protein
MMLPSGIGFDIFMTFQPASCCLASGASDLLRASLILAMIFSKSPVLSGRMATLQSARSPSIVNF